MLLNLYDKNTTDFTNNGFPLHYVFDDHVIRDDGFYLKFKMAIDEDEEYKLVKKEMIISALTPDGVNQFRVYDITPSHDYVEVVALQLFYHLDHRLVEPFELKKADGILAIKTFAGKFKSGIEPYTFSSDVLEKHDFKTITHEGFEDKTHNALEIANRIASRWDSEFALNGFDVHMTKRLGKRTNALLHEKKNISEFEFPISMRNVVTRIYAKSKWTIGHDEEGYVENGNNERELLVTVDSPLINEYSQIYEAEYTNNDCRTEKELINWARLKYSTDNIDKPKRSIKVETNIIDGEVINYGDELVLKYLVHDVDEVIRCVGYDFSPVGEVFNSITLGNSLDSFASVMNNNLNEATDRQLSRIETLKKQVDIVQTAANGINRIAYGENPVPNPIDGDIWFKYTKDRPNEVRMLVFDGESGMWIDRTPVAEVIQNEINDIINQFDTERTETEQSINEALDSAIAEAERLDEERQSIIDGQIAEVISQADSDRQSTSESISNAISEAERLANEIYKYYDTALLTTIWYRGESPDMQRISGQKNLVELLVETAQISKEQANKAYLDAVAEAESKVQAKDDEYQSVFDDYDLALQQATQDIQTALSKADDALEEAGISTDLADTAKGLAEQAKQTADEATAEVAEIPTKISNYIDSKGLVDGNFVDEKVDEATGAWSLELARVESLALPETFTVLTATWLRGENPQMNLSQVKNKIPQRGHVLYGAIWTKGHDPIMKRTTSEQALAESVSIFGAEYKRDVEGIYHELTRVESNIPSLDGYATQYWANNRFETAQSVSQKLSAYTNTESLNSLLADKANLSDIPSLTGYAKESWVENKNYQTASEINQMLTSYAKVSDLTGMVTESTLATKNYVTAGTMSTTLTDYLKTTDLDGKVKETASFQNVKETTDRFTRVIGSTDAEAKTNIAQIAMSGQIFQTSLNDILDNKGYITDTTLTMSATWVKGADPVMQRTSKLEELIRLANSAQSGVEEINRNIKLESIMGMTWFKRPSPRMQPINKLDALNSAVSVAQSKITQLSDMIDLRVTKEGLIGAINIQAGKTIFQQGTNKLMLTTDTFYMPSATIESAQIKNINASKIYGTSAEFNSVRAGVLTANAVKSTHIEASTTLIDKLFATSALIGELTSKTAFINSIKAVEIDASKITSGTINSARIDVTDLRTKLLTAEVITASMLKVDSALFDKLFAGTSMTDRLIAKGAWITNANISSLDASKITSGQIDSSRINVSEVRSKILTTNMVKASHILANEALFTKLFTDDLATQKLATKQAWIKSGMIGEAQIGTAQIGQIDASNGKIVNFDAQYITANHAKLVSAGFQGLNSNMYVDGGAIRINNNDGDFATMNAIPEFRSQDSLGTAAIMGKGRSQYYSGNQSRFYIGSSLNGDEYNGSVVHGVHISKGQTWGIYRQSDAFGGTPAQYFKTPTGWGAVQVIEELMRTGKIVNNFSQASALIRGLNGWGNSFPVLQPGDMVMYQAAIPGNSSGIERILTMGTSLNGTTRTYSHVHHVFEGGTTGVSDARLKHDIKPTDIKALDHIADLSFKQFKWNRNDELEPLGLIAQESGILRVPDEEMEGIDLQRAMMLALKGIQELSKKVQEMGA